MLSFCCQGNVTMFWLKKQFFFFIIEYKKWRNLKFSPTFINKLRSIWGALRNTMIRICKAERVKLRITNIKKALKHKRFKAFSLAEKERFELSNGFTRYTISSRAPSTKLGDFSIGDERFAVNGNKYTTLFSARQEGICANFPFFFSFPFIISIQKAPGRPFAHSGGSISFSNQEITWHR